MSLENEFADQRFPQRMARDVSYYYPGRHFKPAHKSHGIGWALACIAAVALVGYLLSRSV
jgi:hypothetical protein